MVGDQGVVGLLDFAVMELSAEFTVGVGISCQDDDTAGIPVESVNDASFGKLRLHPADQTVGLIRTDPRHRKQAGWLVDYEEAVVLMNDGWQHVLGDRLPRVMNTPTAITTSFLLNCTLGLSAVAVAQETPAPDEEWKESEAVWLADPVQLTSHDDFVKAGEGYFSPDGSMIIFQAVEQVAPGNEPDEFYAMFVADTEKDDSGRTKGIKNVRRLSPKGSANTCGWFHPTDPNIVLFASTITAPQEADAPGYQRGSNRYRWQFPPGMRIVAADLRTADGTAKTLESMVGDGTAYVAEGSMSADGRYLVYTTLAQGQGDLFVKDLAKGETVKLITAPGYDGGPFFSPQGDRITYRSDRHGNNLLQLFVADLDITADGRITGVRQEHQLTDNTDVNWCPFWHPDGTHLIYGTSAVSHRNYEIFALDAARDRTSTPPSSRYGTAQRRITFGPGADVLPVFNHDASEMMWTSKRGPDSTSQLWVAEFVGDLSSPSAAPAGGER